MCRRHDKWGKEEKLIEFKQVSYNHPDGTNALNNINLKSVTNKNRIKAAQNQ